MTAQLQVALDRIPIEQAEGITRAVRDSADWIEVGTSLIKRYGLAGISRIVQAAGSTPVLADFKIADDARTELTMAAEAGARSVTVLGLAAAGTLSTAIDTADEIGIELMVDLMELSEAGRERVAGTVSQSCVLAAHVPKDAQSAGRSPADLLGPWAAGRHLALAGGLNLRDVPGLSRLGDIRLIVGSAITAAYDPATAAGLFRAAIHSTQEQFV